MKVTKDEVQRLLRHAQVAVPGQPESREVRHILVEKKPLADQIYAQLKAGANFEALAKKYSKDPGSAANGGKLNVSKGQTVPEFDKKTFELKTGELSQPVKTQYGYHIIQALSDIKTATKTPLAKVEGSIKQQLEKQQKNEAMAKWAQDMKKNYCDGRIKYQVGYQPATDPCATRNGRRRRVSELARDARGAPGADRAAAARLSLGSRADRAHDRAAHGRGGLRGRRRGDRAG